MSLPPRQRRQAHEDRVDVAAGLEAEERAAIVEKVELDVAAAEFEEALHVLLGEGRVHAPADELRDDVEESFSDVLREGEMRVEMVFEIIVEDAADAARNS